MDKGFDYRITATLKKDDSIEWVTRYFILARIPLPSEGSKIQICCRRHIEFDFYVNDKPIWLGIIPFQLQIIEPMINVKLLPPDALEKALNELSVAQ